MNLLVDNRRYRSSTILALVALVLGSLALSNAPSAAVAPVTVEPSARLRADEHRYSDPIYHPLRQSVFISCARTNCTAKGGVYHGHWAQDFTGDSSLPWDDPDLPGSDDPFVVYAMGAGQVSIERNQMTCTSDGGEEASGTVLSIDHGGGIVSVYKHLDIEVKDGQWVTPRTRLGTMAGWGSNGCSIAYLHIETHRNGRAGKFTAMNALRACSSGKVRIWPDDLVPYDDPTVDGTPPAYETWDDTTPYFEIPRAQQTASKIPASDNSCIPRSNATPDRPARPDGTIGADSITVNWSVPAEKIRETVLALEIYRPSQGAWSLLGYEYVKGTQTSYTYKGLDEGRSYRVSIAHRNSVGSSEWSNMVQLVPGRPPDAPEAPRRINARSTTVNYAWYRAVVHGYVATGYEAAIRSYRKGEWTDWTVTKVSDLDVEFTGLASGADHQVRVRALSDVGASDWSTRTDVSTPRA